MPADVVLELTPHQVLSAGLQTWVAETGAQLPFRQAAERLERVTGIGLGVEETVRTPTQQVGSARAERQLQAAETVQLTQAAAEPVDAVRDVLVVEADGVLVHSLSGWLARGETG